MGGIKFNGVFLLMVLQIFLVATTTGDETYESDQKTVKPLLDIIRQLRNKLEQSETKEKQISELNYDLMEKYHEIVRIHETLMKEADLLNEYKNKVIKGENDLQLCQNKVDKSESEINSQQNIILKLKEQLTDKSTKLNKPSDNIREEQKKIQLKLTESETKLSQSALDKLNATTCIPFGENPGIHQLNVSGIGLFNVLCDSQLAGPGWIVIEQRVRGNESFYRDWATYRKGFGSFESDFFLGLEKLHRITSLQRFELYIHLVALDGRSYNARYDDFKISDEDNGYALSLGKFSGTISQDVIRSAENMKFTTFDHDNDEDDDDNCAIEYLSGWWFKYCTDSNLNTPYLYWYPIPLKEIKMLIRPTEEMKK